MLVSIALVWTAFLACTNSVFTTFPAITDIDASLNAVEAAKVEKLLEFEEKLEFKQTYKARQADACESFGSKQRNFNNTLQGFARFHAKLINTKQITEVLTLCDQEIHKIIAHFDNLILKERARFNRSGVPAETIGLDEIRNKLAKQKALSQQLQDRKEAAQSVDQKQQILRELRAFVQATEDLTETATRDNYCLLLQEDACMRQAQIIDDYSNALDAAFQKYQQEVIEVEGRVQSLILYLQCISIRFAKQQNLAFLVGQIISVQNNSIQSRNKVYEYYIEHMYDTVNQLVQDAQHLFEQITSAKKNATEAVLNDDDICSICLEKYTHPFKLSTCPHEFCITCLQNWCFKGPNQNCAVCRTSMDANEIEDIKTIDIANLNQEDEINMENNVPMNEDDNASINENDNFSLEDDAFFGAGNETVNEVNNLAMYEFGSE